MWKRIAIGAVIAVLAIALIAVAASKGSTPSASPAVTVTDTAPAQAGPTTTVTVTAPAPTANAAGQATTISDGEYVVGKDIPAGTWHTAGGSDCYYALLASDNTSNIITNNISSGPQTLTTSGAHAVDLSGGCTWTHER